MAVVENLHADLAYIDSTPSESQIAAARALIADENTASTRHATSLHPSIPVAYEPSFSQLVVDTHERISQSGKSRMENEGIDLSRYEEPEPPALADKDPDRQAWIHALQTAATSQQYLNQREMNLGLLEKYGKNAWLIGNSHLEEELGGIERELKAAKDVSVHLDNDRRERQVEVEGELHGLQDTFRVHLGRAVEAEVATAALKHQLRKPAQRQPTNR